MALTTFSPKDRVPLPRTILHFAYGVNMNPAQISLRCARPKVVAAACLPDYSLTFCGRTGVWDGGMEAVASDPGHMLWGVLYELSLADAESLDSWQGVRLDGAGLYFHYPVTVSGRDGETWNAAIYKKDELREGRPPSREQLDFIVQGALANHLPEEYINELRRILSVPASYPVPKLVDAAPSSGSCSFDGPLDA